MSVATSLVNDQPAPVSPAPAEVLYPFHESPLLARQSRQESNARSYPRRIPLALKRARGIYVEDVEGRRFIDCLACGPTGTDAVEAVLKLVRTATGRSTVLSLGAGGAASWAMRGKTVSTGGEGTGVIAA